MPPQCDYDRVKYLIRDAYPVRSPFTISFSPLSVCQQYLDPFSGAKRESMFWSVIKAFKGSFTAQVLFLICSVRN